MWDRPTKDTAWSVGLPTGANGPIPFIVVDQFGYRTQATKVAVIRSPRSGYDNSASFTPGKKYAVVRDGASVKVGEPRVWNDGKVDESSGDRVWWFDFSDVRVPGVYTVVDLDNKSRSVEFEIDDGIYKNVLRHAVRTYFYQRAGFEKSAQYAGDDWADKASHVGPGQDREARSWQAKWDSGTRRDLHGGWYDAGDYNKYTSWAARTLIVLLTSYSENAAAFGDDFGIPESGNGVADLLDEIRWSLEWLIRAQNPDGSLLCVQGLAAGSPPSSAAGPSYYGPPTTAATLMGAAAFALASQVFAARADTAARKFADDLKKRAVQAWTWAEMHPRILYYNNDDIHQPGSAGLGAGQQEMDDAGRLLAKFYAALYLYEITSGAEYKAFAETNYALVEAKTAPNQWDTEKQEALLHFSDLPIADQKIRQGIVDRFLHNMARNADQLPMVLGDADPYRAPIKDYVWGSNMSKATQARLYQLLSKYADAPELRMRAAAAAEEYLHYLHGVNPLGLVYLTNMARAGAEHSARTMFHMWFGEDSQRWSQVSSKTPGPPPGYLVGGPNSAFAIDDCCSARAGTAGYHCYGSPKYASCRGSYSPPKGQPAQKSYLQFNSGWPAASWSVTEPSTGYQAQYVRVLAAYAR